MHRALSDSYKLDQPASDYYAYHPDKDDNDYLRVLICACRENASRLASYALVQQTLIGAAHDSALALSINHEADPIPRRAKMRSWASSRPATTGVTWFEMTAAGAAALEIFALLAEATKRTCNTDALTLISGAYSPWICSAATMLDSYADQAGDEVTGSHVYVNYYPTPEAGVKRISDLIRQGFARDHSLPDGQGHTIILSSMIAMYLTRNSSRVADRRDFTAQILLASGKLTRALAPALRAWRTLYGLRSS